MNSVVYLVDFSPRWTRVGVGGPAADPRRSFGVRRGSTKFLFWWTRSGPPRSPPRTKSPRRVRRGPERVRGGVAD